MGAVIDDPNGFTPQWCTAVLGANGLAAEVAGVSVEPVGTGQTGAAYRLRLTYAGGTSPHAPATLIAKIGAGTPAARQRVRAGYRKEVEFYRRLAHTVDVHTPTCWHAKIADDDMSFTLLLDEVVGARPGVQADGCSLEQAIDVIENAAALHAARWNDPALASMRFLTPIDPDRAAFLAELAGDSTTTFIDRYGDALTGAEQSTLGRCADAYLDWLLADHTPLTLVHGDYRLDNFMFDGSNVTVLDWQTLTVAPPLRDVAYFLGTSLPIDVRRAEELPILDHYYRALLRRGVTGYDRDRCHDDYRLGQLQGPFITVIGATLATAIRSTSSDEMFLAMARRSCAAIRDLDPFGLL